MAQFIIYVPKTENDNDKKEPLSLQRLKSLETTQNTFDSKDTKDDNKKTKERQENKKNEDKGKVEKTSDEIEEMDMTLEKALHHTLNYFNIDNAVWTLTDDEKYFQVTFPCEAGDRLENIMAKLSIAGIGEKDNSSMSIVACSLYFHPEEDENEEKLEENADQEEHSSHKKNQFIQSIKSRMTVAQVVEGVKFLSTPTFDFVVLNVLAALLAALGLAESSPVSLVASMLVSPLIGPIMGGTFGVIIQDHKLRNLGFKSEVLGLSLCLISGFIFGLITSHFSSSWGAGVWPTTEMYNRGNLRSLWIGVLISLPSGAGVALSILGGNQGSLVGVAISAALLPSAVNGGLLWALALVRQLKSLSENGLSWVNDTNRHSDLKLSLQPPEGYNMCYHGNMVKELAILGIVSFALTIINSLCIFLTGVVVLKIKEVAPYKNLNPTKDFWTQDIKVARDYNKANPDMEDNDDSKPPGKRLLEEWATINQIDPETISMGLPDDKTAEVALTFKDMIEEIELDPKYQGVIRGLPPRSMPQPLSRALPNEWKRFETQVAVENSIQQTIQGLTPLAIRKSSLISLPADALGRNSISGGSGRLYGGRLSNAFLHQPHRRSLSNSSASGIMFMRSRSPSVVESGQLRREFDKPFAEHENKNSKFCFENELMKPKINVENPDM